MSLEKKLDNLTLTIEKLTAVLELQIASANVEKVVEKVVEEAEKVVEEVEEVVEEVEEVEEVNKEIEVSADDLKAACLKAARAKDGNKAKVKALLAEFGATVVKDIAPALRVDVLNRLEKGEF